MASTSQDSSPSSLFSSSRIDDIHFEWKKVQLENMGDFDISSGTSFLWHQQNGRFFAVTASQPGNDLELACFKLEKGSTKAVLERVCHTDQKSQLF
jgi:hypothetical protein